MQKQEMRHTRPFFDDCVERPTKRQRFSEPILTSTLTVKAWQYNHSRWICGATKQIELEHNKEFRAGELKQLIKNAFEIMDETLLRVLYLGSELLRDEESIKVTHGRTIHAVIAKPIVEHQD
jgi:hypothetical protein